MKNLTIFKFEPTKPNTSPHVTTHGWPNARNILPPTVLRYVAMKCCDHLAGAWCCSLAKSVQQFCAVVRFSMPNWSQHLATWWPNARNMLRPTMLRFVAFKSCGRLAAGWKWSNIHATFVDVAWCCSHLARATILLKGIVRFARPNMS